jgi:hypothetical protein
MRAPSCGRLAREAVRGAVAQLGERCVRNAEVEGSIPFRSTIILFQAIPQHPGKPLEPASQLRWRAQGRGKRGGYRVIYFLRTAEGLIVLVLLYSKNVLDNVEPELLKQLKARYGHGQADR